MKITDTNAKHQVFIATGRKQSSHMRWDL